VLDSENYNRIAQAMPFLQTIDPQLVREFQRAAYHVRIPAGREIFVEDDQVDGIALLMSGEVRVYKIGETGRELTLYRFGRGESCVITANAILNMQNFPAIAVVEEDAEAVMVPAGTFNEWVRRYDPWREFVFQLISQRLADVMEIVEEVAFHRMDRRIASFLMERMQEGNPILITHQAIANELGTSREVVSRLLADFASREAVSLGRGEISVLDPEALEAQLSM
jgi:CRP/FNR family transcriptional regulator